MPLFFIKMETSKEIWKPIEGYEGIYEISSFGRVKSFYGKKNIFGRILNPNLNKYGYPIVRLCKDKKAETTTIHRLVATAFLNYKYDRVNSVINHIDGNKTNNNLSNLEIVTQRKNLSTCFRRDRNRLTSKFPGVSFDRTNKKWMAVIAIKRKHIFQKRFDSELEAAAAYQSKLIELGLN
jgi:ribosomal protein L22